MKELSSRPMSPRDYFFFLWNSRRLIVVLGRNDVKNKYASTLLGVVLIVVKLCLMGLIYWLVFDRILNVGSENVPYILFIMPGVMGWQLFVSILGEGSSALLQHKPIATKTNIPKVILPLSKMLSPLYEFCIGLLCLGVVLIFVQNEWSISLIMFPVFVLLNLFAGISMAVWVSIFSVRKRDLMHLIPYLAGFGMFVTPVFYPTAMVPAEWSFILYVNPMAFVIEGYRYALYNTSFPSSYYLLSLIPLCYFSIHGYIQYRKNDRRVVDFL